MKKSQRTELAAIRAALHKRGYRMRKQPKQAVWKVIINPDHFYLLTYQTSPVSAWVLDPQNNDTRRQAIETIIQDAIKKQPTASIKRAS
jgi:hypothetical protein